MVFKRIHSVWNHLIRQSLLSQRIIRSNEMRRQTHQINFAGGFSISWRVIARRVVRDFGLAVGCNVCRRFRILRGCFRGKSYVGSVTFTMLKARVNARVTEKNKQKLLIMAYNTLCRRDVNAWNKWNYVFFTLDLCFGSN